MAPPPTRRPGYDRKAQYRYFASYVVAIGGALVGLLLAIISVLDPAGFAVLRAAGAEVTRPVSLALRSMVQGVGSADEYVAGYIRAGSQNAALRREVEASRPRLIEAAAIRQENERLKKLLKLVDEDEGEVVAGRLISSTATSIRRMARLSVGAWQGVAAGMPVRASEGLIGRVVMTSPNTADVLLLTDRDNIVPVRRPADNIAGLSTGLGDGTLLIRGVAGGANPFRPGDILVTSGTGGLYRPNIPVAIVVRGERDQSIAVPLANPARVELVIVQRPFQAPAPPQPAPPVPAVPGGGDTD
jgi:rod shape-determining protein MreC